MDINKEFVADKETTLYSQYHRCKTKANDNTNLFLHIDIKQKYQSEYLYFILCLTHKI